MSLRLFAVVVLLVPGCVFASAPTDAAERPIGCDLPERGPRDTEAYTIIRDLINADAIAGRAFVERVKAQDQADENLSEFFAAIEREARADECAAWIVERYDRDSAIAYL